MSLICKDVWTQLVKRDNALVLEQYSEKKLVGVSAVPLFIRKCAGFIKGQSIYGHLHCN